MDAVPAAIDQVLYRTIDNGGHVCVLTGAGMSAESGIPTFRGTHDSLWSRFDPMRLATAEAWREDPALVWGWYRWRMRLVRDAQPNAGHRALAALAQRVPLSLVTQNVDDLHERAGSRALIHMHGQLSRALCAACGSHWDAPATMAPADRCPDCGARATRPDIVWFGEMPYQMEVIWSALRRADIFAAIGTSGQVYPAAAFVQDAARAGAETVELNLAASAVSADFDRCIEGPASQTVPLWVETLR